MTGRWIERPEGGAPAALRLLCAFVFSFGRWPARAILHPIALYFMIRRGPERRASREFLGRVLGRRATVGDVYRHILRFSQVTLDRLFLLSEGTRRFRIETTGLDQVHELLALGRGILLFGAHFGSYEVTRVLALGRPDIGIRTVIDIDQNPSMSQLLNALNPALAATVINARRAGPAVALAIKDALEARALVALLVDRARPGGRTAAVRFLGSTAAFPTAPWEIAAALGAPVVLYFGVYHGGNRYHLNFETLAERIGRERDGGRPLSEWIQAFADRLAARVTDAPFNWFNFYDFWGS
jgi:predicted LPLAT superfamily acyltransferase